MTNHVQLIDVTAHRARIGDRIDRRLSEVANHGKWIMGPEVAQFEEAAQRFIGGDKVQAIGCANGTDALVLALQALELQPGQAVVCPAFTFVATAEAVALLGGIPVFADVQVDGFNICPDSARSAVKHAQARGLTVAGICAVDLFGVPADYRALSELCAEQDIWLLADAAQSFGAATNGNRVGTLATVTTTSFFPAKPLGCYGDGGMVMTTDEEIAAAIRSLRVHGKGSDKYDNVRVGQNSRLDTIQAAVLLEKLAILDDELVARDRVADYYARGLADHVSLPAVPHGSSSAWAQFTVVVDQRDALQQHLNARGIGNAVYYPKPLHQQSGYRRYASEDVSLDQTEWLTSRVLSLPMHPYLSDDELAAVVEAVSEASAGAPAPGSR